MGLPFSNAMASRRGGRTFLTAGLPFVTFIVGGSYMLSEFVSGQVHVKDVRKRSKSLREFDIEEVGRYMHSSVYTVFLPQIFGREIYTEEHSRLNTRDQRPETIFYLQYLSQLREPNVRRWPDKRRGVPRMTF